MLRTEVLAFLAFSIGGTSAVFVGGKEGNGPIRGHLLLGANKCTWGPGYWCKNISTTHECGAIQHCVTKQWNSLELDQDKSSSCQMCENTLEQLRSMMKANLTVDVIEGFVDQLCVRVFIPGKVCEKYLDPYIEEIHTAIVNNIKPQVICHTIHFCNNEEGTFKTYERLALAQGDTAEYTQVTLTKEETQTTQVLSDAALAAVMPLGPVILTGNKPFEAAPLGCSDGQVYWCKSIENAKQCNAFDHCKQVVWAHQKNSPISDITTTSTSPLSYTRIPLSSVECSRGQTFWCGSLAAAASCSAVQHCIQSVWTHMRVDEDGDDVCKICKDMVKQARDQLTSNETQSELKAVFEGSCNLMPVKVIREGCDKLVDDFVPELVEVLSSQMNPDVVCSVAGLCNNVRIDQILEAKTIKTSPSASKVSSNDNSDCKNCASFADLLTRKFTKASDQELMNVFRNFCSEFSTFSDMCLKMVTAHGSEWIKNLGIYFSRGMVTDRHFPFSVLNMCRVNNMCNNQTISSTVLHPGIISVEVSHKSESGVLSHEAAEANQDLPCSLCDQLVKHLQDILVANTTETEFKEVLTGICKQTGAFSSECKDLVEQYYTLIYTFLTSELNPNVICVDVGLCPRKPTLVFNNLDILNAMPVPVVPIQVAPVKQLPSHIQSGELSDERLELTSEEIHMKKPVHPLVMIESTTKPACTFCEYILHFVQEQVADTKNEKKILSAMDQACKQMPGEFATECDQFVQEYGPAFIALVIQQIDPSQVCPKLKVCSVGMSKAPISFAENHQSKGACPLCLMAVQALNDAILNNRTEENIKNHLDSICSSLSKPLASDCARFINLYYEELIDMLVAETSPQEICVYMRLCHAPKRIATPVITKEEASLSSDSLDKDSQACILCEFVMTKLDKIIEDKKTEEEIKHAVHSVCRIMPKTVKQECDDFVNTYADLIIQLLGQSLNPKQICEALNVCKPNNRAVPVSQCAVCEEAMSHLDDALADPDVKNNNIKTALDKVCYHVDQTEFDDCNKFILKYGTKILTIVDSTPSYLICKKIQVCADPSGRLALLGEEQSSVAHLASPAENGEKEEQCKTWLGVTLCQSQVLVVLIGILMCGSLIVIFVIARSVRRTRLNRGVTSPPYEKLYQPTTVPSHAADDFTATIVR